MRPHPINAAASAALAFISACVAHEALGHGGACLASGRTVELLSSVYFRCSQGSPWIDAAGPANNLLFGLVSLLLLRFFPGSLYLKLTFAFNFAWGFGYFLFSSVTNKGDLAYFLRDLPLTPTDTWRTIFFGIGVVGYALTLFLIRRLKIDGPTLRLGYLAAGAVAIGSTFFWSGSTLPAMKEAIQESLGASLGLFFLARSLPVVREQQPLHRPSLWVALAGIAVFFATLGRGFRG